MLVSGQRGPTALTTQPRSETLSCGDGGAGIVLLGNELTAWAPRMALAFAAVRMKLSRRIGQLLLTYRATAQGRRG
jgi:hypothetical protein